MTAEATAKTQDATEAQEKVSTIPPDGWHASATT